MSTPDETSQPLTRRQLRELKLTGQTAVISAEEIEAARVAREAEEVRVAEEARQADAARKAEQARSAEEARRAEESRKAEEAAALLAAAEESSAPAGDDEGGPRLTRREIREQERLRTNQLAVITQEDQDAAAEAASEPNVAAIETKVVGENETSVVYEVVEVPFDQRPAAQPQAPVERLHFDEDEDEGEDAAVDAQTPPAPARRADDEFAEGAVETVFVPEDAPAEAVAPQARPTLAPDFGQKVQAAPVVPPAASFEDILSQAAADSSGSGTASSALILSSLNR